MKSTNNISHATPSAGLSVKCIGVIDPEGPEKNIYKKIW